MAKNKILNEQEQKLPQICSKREININFCRERERERQRDRDREREKEIKREREKKLRFQRYFLSEKVLVIEIHHT